MRAAVASEELDIVWVQEGSDRARKTRVQRVAQVSNREARGGGQEG
jgi:hypothetical protein